MGVKEAFNKHAKIYDQNRQMLIPQMDEFNGVAAQALELIENDEPKILDMGAGTGLMAWFALQKRPRAIMTLADMAEDMLEQAKDRFAGQDVKIIVADYVHDDLGGPYDAIVSCLSIHHVETPEKKILFRRCYDLLEPGGIFVNADMIQGPTTQAHAWYDDVWERRVRAAGTTDLQMAQARERMEGDRLDTLADQLVWLDEAGFADIDVLYKWYSLCVYIGRKPVV